MIRSAAVQWIKLYIVRTTNAILVKQDYAMVIEGKTKKPKYLADATLQKNSYGWLSACT